MLPRRRSLLAFAGALALGRMLTACAPDAAPTPTPKPAFASDEEAFAAAEKVYRAYNDAGNARNAGRAKPDPRDFLIGEALEADIDASNLLVGSGVSIQGPAEIDSIHYLEFQPGSPAEVRIAVCLDVSEINLLDRDGVDVTPPERPAIVGQEVTMMTGTDGLLIAVEESLDSTSC